MTKQYVLKWRAAPRPSVHPNWMEGTQSFNSVEDAAAFFGRQASDAVFVSLTEIQTITTDVSDQFNAIVGATA